MHRISNMTAAQQNELPDSLERHLPSSTERRSKFLKPGPGWTVKELRELVVDILDGLDGCSLLPIDFSLATANRIRGFSRRARVTLHHGEVNVVLTQESWTRRARRAKIQASDVLRGPMSKRARVPKILFSSPWFRSARHYRAIVMGSSSRWTGLGHGRGQV